MPDISRAATGAAPDPLHARLRKVRDASVALAEPLSAEDCALQSMPDASPIKWHLAHTSWYFETFVLETVIPGYRAFRDEFRVLFNSYYNSVGEQYARPDRGLLSRPSLEDVLEYRRHVDAQLLPLLTAPDSLDAATRDVVELGLHHEQQHQELILTDLKHLFSRNPTGPSYLSRADALAAAERETSKPAEIRYVGFQGGVQEIGHRGTGFAFDNEGPRHRVYLEPFELANRPVSAGEFGRFVEAGGYRDPAHWLADGWAVVQERGWTAPLYWERCDGEWHALTLGGVEPVRPEEPVCHVSYYEADAYARWAGARLASEAEWELAARETEVAGNFVESGALHPRSAPEGRRLSQLYGDVWEWTRSPYVPYPGFVPPPGALGEYNGKFMSNQIVLRGGSCATPRSHIRATYRNFFYPDARWQFSGIRLARNAGS